MRGYGERWVERKGERCDEISGSGFMIHHFPSSIFVIWLHQERERDFISSFFFRRKRFLLPSLPLCFFSPKKLLVSIIPENENPEERREEEGRCNRNLSFI